MNNKTLVQCVETRIATIRVGAGIKPIFVLDLMSETGEIFTKFFGVDRTPAGNYTVKKNSDFAKLYRLTIGRNPAGGFFRCDRVLDHFLGHYFLVDYQLATSKNKGDYLKVTSITPQNPVVTDAWTLTGQLIKKVRAKPCGNLAVFSRFSAENARKSRGYDSTSGLVDTGLEACSNPIQNLPYQTVGHTTLTSYLDIPERRFEKPRPISTSPPQVDLASVTSTHHQIH